MMPFVRQPAPPFWAQKERQLAEALISGQMLPKVMAWQHEQRSLAAWFHQAVRPPAMPRLCAYCDAALGETSAETVDHFIPQHARPELSLCWENLYPACSRCNQTAKGQKWSCALLRPDVDLVGATAWLAFARWFDFDPVSGRLRPAPEGTPRMRARVRLTLRVFQLNTEERCHARRQRWRDLQNARKAQSLADIKQDAAQGPYRFVAEQVLVALGLSEQR